MKLNLLEDFLSQAKIVKESNKKDLIYPLSIQARSPFSIDMLTITYYQWQINNEDIILNGYRSIVSFQITFAHN